MPQMPYLIPQDSDIDAAPTAFALEKIKAKMQAIELHQNIAWYDFEQPKPTLRQHYRAQYYTECLKTVTQTHTVNTAASTRAKSTKAAEEMFAAGWPGFAAIVGVEP